MGTKLEIVKPDKVKSMKYGSKKKHDYTGRA